MNANSAITRQWRSSSSRNLSVHRAVPAQVHRDRQEAPSAAAEAVAEATPGNGNKKNCRDDVNRRLYFG